jgi:glycosyltransferase involved in cell wall biosynthesis
MDSARRAEERVKKEFSWKKTARLTQKVYEEVVSK